MNLPAPSQGPDYQALYGLFAPGDVPEVRFVSGAEVPEPYHSLLVHEHHMTVTVEGHHGDLVYTQILDRHLAPDFYARKILLCLEKSHRVVQFGIVRVFYKHLTDPVREAIVAGQTPFGRVLIQHNVLRRIEPTAYMHVIPSPAMMKWFNLDRPLPTYGRLAYIHCDEQPAVELIEIVAPAS
ncbi:MAG: hypothetical protein K2R98_20750 [Gemmataceae bacterium]|nr:hypothetical protein [Gemmataceae bacterium]